MVFSFTDVKNFVRKQGFIFVGEINKKYGFMKVNIFNGYRDTNPKESTLEELVRMMREDAWLRELTEKHRYYKSLGLMKEAKEVKSSGLNFAVAARFRNGKDMANIYELTFMGLVEFDHLQPEEVEPLAETLRNDPHTMLEHISIGEEGVHALFCYVVTNLTEKDRNRYADIYGAAFDVACAYYLKLTGKQPDMNCRKSTQLSGLASDPNVFYRPDAVPFEVELPPAETLPKQPKVSLLKAVKASKEQLAEEDIHFVKGSRNKFLMRMGYLLNAYGVPQDDATDWAIGKYAKRYDGDILGIFRACYQKTQEHGTLKLPKASRKETHWATVEEIERFLDSQVRLRYNVIRRQCEICWKNSGGCTQILRDAQDDTVDAQDDTVDARDDAWVAQDETKDCFTRINDRDENTLWCRMTKTGVKVRLNDICNVIRSEYVRPFHPFEAYFHALPAWDGKDYIAELARTVHVKGEQERFVECFRKWFVGILAALFDEQVVNHEILVFIGRQGNFKSTFFSLLLPPPLQSYFQVKMNSSHLNKDDMLTLCEKALVCLEEIDELRRSDLNQLKALVTAKDISERAAYARNKEDRKHIASFCGTGNNPHFLSDPTDNRRWLVFEVEDIDNPRLYPFNYTGIYSQAMALWKSGFRYWFDQDEIRTLNLVNKDYEVPNLEGELVLTYFRPTFEGCQGAIFLKVSEILERINMGVRQPLSPTKLGMLLGKLGFVKCKYGGERGYLLLERSSEEIKASQKMIAAKLL